MLKVKVAGRVDPNIILNGDEIKLINKRTGKFIEFANEVFEWCADNNIEADLIGRHTDDNLNDLSIWRIENEYHRTKFALRWL